MGEGMEWIFVLLVVLFIFSVGCVVGNFASTDYMFNNCIVTDINGQQSYGQVFASEISLSVVDENSIKKIMPKDAVVRIEVIKTEAK